MIWTGRAVDIVICSICVILNKKYLNSLDSKTGSKRFD